MQRHCGVGNLEDISRNLLKLAYQMFSNRYETLSVWQVQGRGCKLKHLYQKDWREKKVPPDYSSGQNGGEFGWLWAERRQVVNGVCVCTRAFVRVCVCVYACVFVSVCLCSLGLGNLGFILQTNHPQSQPVPSDTRPFQKLNWGTRTQRKV